MQNFKKVLNKKILVSFITVFAFVGLVVLFSGTVRSSPLDNVSGFGWSAEKVNPTDEPGGMGWLSFNCSSDPTDPDCIPNYGLNINEQTGAITGANGPGFAWSPNFGWLQFGGLSGFPVGPGTVSSNAQVDLQTGIVSGWARFCAPASAPLSCLGWNGPNTFNGGWDGWVSLKGTTQNSGQAYGVTLNGDTFEGYAWGGGTDTFGNYVTGTGWISFSGIGYAVQYIPLTDPTVFLSVVGNQTTIPVGGNANLEWTGTGLINDSEGCIATLGTGTWPGLRPSPSGIFNTGALNTAGQFTYTIKCYGPDGIELSNESSITLNVGIQLNMFSVPEDAYPNDYKVTLYWEPIPSDGPLHGCVPTDNGSVATGWETQIIADMPPGGFSVPNVYVPDNPTRFTLSCLDAENNPVSQYVDVNRATVQENIDLYTTDPVVGPDGNGNYSVLLKWFPTYVEQNSCHGYTVPTTTTPPTGWEVPDPKANEGSQTVLVPFVLDPVNEFTYYHIECIGEITGKPVTDVLPLNQNSQAGGVVTPIYTEE